jgi:hypothetical protein
MFIKDNKKTNVYQINIFSKRVSKEEKSWFLTPGRHGSGDCRERCKYDRICHEIQRCHFGAPALGQGKNRRAGVTGKSPFNRETRALLSSADPECYVGEGLRQGRHG